MSSMLAAVRAAALGSTSSAAITAAYQGETDMSQAAAAPAASPATPAVKLYTQVELDAAISAAHAEGRTAGADAERTRILGIEKAALPGHADLVAQCKADGKTTPAEVALRIIEAEKAKLGAHAQAIADVESETSKVKPAARSATPAAPPPASTPDGWKAEYAASVDLQAEFGSESTYVAYQQGIASGRIRILKKA